MATRTKAKITRVKLAKNPGKKTRPNPVKKGGGSRPKKLLKTREIVLTAGGKIIARCPSQAIATRVGQAYADAHNVQVAVRK